MDPQVMKQKMKEARGIPYMAEFKHFMRTMQGFTDDDFAAPVSPLKKKVLAARETDPLAMFERIMDEATREWTNPNPLPVNTEWHHFIIPGVIIAALRNNGYAFTDKDVEEAMFRGEKVAGGSCGFMGTCGGACSVGIVGSMVKRTNPIWEQERSDVFRLAAGTLNRIAEYPRRCCKRSSYIALAEAIEFLQNNGFGKIPQNAIVCKWSTQNGMCLGVKCPFHAGRQKA